MLSFFWRKRGIEAKKVESHECKKIDLNKDKLVICRMGVLKYKSVIEYVSESARRESLYYNLLPERIILASDRVYDDTFYVPKTIDTADRIRYRTANQFLRAGDIFVLVDDATPIQYTDFGRKYLTEEEKREGKITLERIEELEKMLNCT